MKDLSTYPVMNSTFSVKEVEGDASIATIVIEPLEQGYGHTIGNALRRVLLSSLPGSAITMVKIDGVDHQYTTLEGMTEDVVELILNLKQVRVKSMTSEEQAKISLDVKGPGDITAASITPESGVEIINPNQHLVTLAKGQSLKFEARVESGMGYQTAQEAKIELIGEIPVDALFSPVIKVAYRVEQTRVGRRTDYDKIVMQIQTDGTMSALETVKAAARILHRQFQQVFDPVLPEPVDVGPELTPEEAEILRLTVEELDLPTRIANALRKGGFKTVADLQNSPRSIITKVKNLGEKSVEIIDEALEKKGIKLGGGQNEA
ncbi:DNA-directed RNA polymerase subunit alpha [Patescibacteria group bacterium]|nr:DNA-directed RNA polymerase subunit alpha [Patescibacteria group bacterium]MBU1966732.1 DNA-directed RNA polymerase subunit alpha [Patescibacteria group bacterium]MBU2543740.1 DNA-directed RNA polymerase subunit alpha [Patescibacteria group bacterium]